MYFMEKNVTRVLNYYEILVVNTWIPLFLALLLQYIFSLLQMVLLR